MKNKKGDSVRLDKDEPLYSKPTASDLHPVAQPNGEVSLGKAALA